MRIVKSLFPVEAIKQTIWRFPLSVVSAITLFSLIFIELHDLLDWDEALTSRMAAMALCGYLWFGITKIIAESRRWSFVNHLMCAVPVFIGIGLLVFLSEQWVWSLIFIIPALFLLIMVAPFTGKDQDDLSFWMYNKSTWFGAALAILASIILGGGLSAALASMDYLFGVNIDHKIYQDIWTFSCLIVGPIYALSWIPKSFTFGMKDYTEPPGLSFMVNWVLAPLGILYLVILYAYFAKILLMGELPRGQLSYMITGFAGIGIVTYLVGWPLRDIGTRHLKLLYRFFFPALILPVGMQALSIFERVNQYGITEQRYLIIMTAIWLAIVAVIFTWKKPALKTVPAILAVLCVLASFGPWSGVSMSTLSQQARFERLLHQYDILKEGQITKTEQEVSFEDSKSITSIVNYLSKTNKQNILLQYVDEEQIEKQINPDIKNLSCNEKQWDYQCRNNYLTIMGVTYRDHWEQEADEENFYLYSDQEQKAVDIRGYSAFYSNLYMYKDHNNMVERSGDSENVPHIHVEWKGNILHFRVDDKAPVTIDMAQYVRTKITKTKTNQGQVPGRYSVTKMFEEMDIKLDFKNLTGSSKNDVIVIDSMQFDLYLKIK